MDAVKNDIRAHLRKVTEASAKQLAKATGHSETEIANALNSMRVYAEVECEQGDRGKGMMYWLTNAAAGDKVMSTTAGNEVSELREKLEDAEQIIANARQALAVKDGESLVLAIEKVSADLVYKTGVIDDYKQKLNHATEQLEAAQALLMDSDEAIDVKDAAKGYLVCAPKRKPAKLMKAESAVARAKSAAKATGRGEVFALVPVGVATRKQIQAVEFKERAA